MAVTAASVVWAGGVSAIVATGVGLAVVVDGMEVV